MQSTQTSREADPHDIFVVEPDVVLAARADGAPPDPISSLLTPPIQPAPELSAAAPVPPVDPTLRAPANDDIHIPRDIHVSGQRPPRSRWAGRATIGFLFALCSAAAAEGWDHYGDTTRDTVKAVIANWTPFALTAQPAGAAAQPGAAAADQASVPAAPTAQPAQDTASPDTASTSTAPAAAAPDQAPSLQSMAQDVASMGQQIASLKASIEQLKASQDQMAQQMSRDVARTPVARTSQARPSEIKPAEPGLRAKGTAALSPRPAVPPRKPRPVYARAQTFGALPPAIAAPPMPQPQPAPMQYEPRAQAVDQADGDMVMRPPMPVR